MHNRSISLFSLHSPADECLQAILRPFQLASAFSRPKEKPRFE
jgi:hypothetical protein